MSVRAANGRFPALGRYFPVAVLAGLFGWLVGVGGLVSGKHLIISLAAGIIGPLSILGTAGLMAGARGRSSAPIPSRWARSGAATACPAGGSAPSLLDEPSHIHIPRPSKGADADVCGDRRLAADTPVAEPAPRPHLVTRRVLLLGGFWSTLLLAVVGVLGSPLDFLWPRKAAGFGTPFVVPATQVPAPGSDPVRFPTGRFYLSHLQAGEEGSAGGILAVYQKCTHLGCTVPWRPDFQFEGTTGWFRCPCHGSTYTKGAAVLVFGPAPRPLDTMAVEVTETGDLVVNTGKITKGGPDNPLRAVPYTTGSVSARDVAETKGA